MPLVLDSIWNTGYSYDINGKPIHGTGIKTDVPVDANKNGQIENILNGNSSTVDPSGTEQAEWEFEHQQMLNAEARAFNSAEAQKTRDWQERMSNTAYQRAVQDLEAAGLNKWLAVTGGNGASASTPSGASASSSSGDASSPNPMIYKALLQFAQAIATSAIKLIDFF